MLPPGEGWPGCRLCSSPGRLVSSPDGPLPRGGNSSDPTHGSSSSLRSGPCRNVPAGPTSQAVCHSARRRYTTTRTVQPLQVGLTLSSYLGVDEVAYCRRYFAMHSLVEDVVVRAGKLLELQRIDLFGVGAHRIDRGDRII